VAVIAAAAAAAAAAVRWVWEGRIRPSLQTVAVRAVRPPQLVRLLPLVWQRRSSFKNVLVLDFHANETMKAVLALVRGVCWNRPFREQD
jgi:hypothetical protein